METVAAIQAGDNVNRDRGGNGKMVSSCEMLEPEGGGHLEGEWETGEFTDEKPLSSKG